MKFDKKQKIIYNCFRIFSFEISHLLYIYFSGMKDFFTRYRESRKHHSIVPAIFGLMFGFAIVTQMTWSPIDLRSLRANVLEANTQKITYDADLIMERRDGTMAIRIGKDAESVETLNFSLLGDPSVFKWVKSSDSRVKIVSNEPGITLVKITVGKSLKSWEVIASLTPTLVGNTSIAMIDAGFTSSGVVYSLSVRWE